MKHARIVRMYDYINQRERVTLEELQHQFNVSLNTIRRDVAQLIAEGKVNKIYGGVCVKNLQMNKISFNDRALTNLDAKDYICSIAAKMIHNGDTVFIDSGTTVQSLLKYLQKKQNITIVTHNVYLVTDAIKYDNINVFSLCGILNRKSGCVIGEGVNRHLETININKAFICASSISENGDVSSEVMCEREIKQQAIRRSFVKYLLVDSSKFIESRFCVFANINQFDFIITDTIPCQKYNDYFNYAGVECIYSITDLEEDKWNYSWTY